MIKRKIHLDKKKIKFVRWQQNSLSKLLKKSFRCNHATAPIARISFGIQRTATTKLCYFYKSQNKLQCFLSYSFRVPYKRLQMSRFYLSRAANKLLMYSYQK